MHYYRTLFTISLLLMINSHSNYSLAENNINNPQRPIIFTEKQLKEFIDIINKKKEIATTESEDIETKNAENWREKDFARH